MEGVLSLNGMFSAETESFGLMTDLYQGEKQFNSGSHIRLNVNLIGKRINGLSSKSNCTIRGWLQRRVQQKLTKAFCESQMAQCTLR